MKKRPVTVLDFSGIFPGERALFPEALERRVQWDVLDFRTLDGTMCFCEEGSAEVIRRRLAEAEAASIHWIDTGDYHYLTYFFLERIDKPFELVLLDNHPDDQPSVFGEGLLSCGGWVRTARERIPMLRKVLTEGGVAGELPVYISIDKDILSPEFARTDWSQGDMTLPQLLAVLEGFRGREILGIDLCGGLTEAKGATPADFALNARLDAALLTTLLDLV